MFQLSDIRKTRVWREAREEGITEGLEKGIEKGLEKGKALAEQDFVGKCLANGMSVKEIAKLLSISVTQVRRLAKNAPK